MTLTGIDPPIWRRIKVRSDISLGILHQILQAAMGWTDSHLHEFRIGEAMYGRPDHEDEGDNIIDERTVILEQLGLRPEVSFIYTYDLGDSWEHELVVEEVLRNTGETPLAVCLDGARRCPPENCGGAPGYREFLWARGRFDPEKFDPWVVNRALRRVPRKRRTSGAGPR